MTLTKTLILCGGLSLLASCVQNDASCAGWRQISASSASVDYLAANDPAALKAVIGHAEFGHEQGCWK